jgi:hypothetical protein
MDTNSKPSKPRKPNNRPRPTRESFYVRIETGDGGVAFVNATEHIGKVMPFKKPRATCAMSVTEAAVSFSLLHLSAKNAAAMTTRPIQLPRGPLARLDRRAEGYRDIGTDEIVVELSTRVAGPEGSKKEREVAEGTGLEGLFEESSDTGLDELFAEGEKPSTEQEGTESESTVRKRVVRPSVIETWRYQLRRDENNVASLEAVDEEHNMELPLWPLHVSLYLKSPTTGHMLAVSFIGFIGKPGAPETMGRIASMVLNSMSHLPEFRILSKVETVAVPAPLGRAGGAVRRAKIEDRAEFTTRVFLFDEALTPVASGLVGIEFDLVNANPTSGRLLVHYTPENTIAEAFERYRAVLDTAIGHALRTGIGDEHVAQITYDIILGGVDAGTVEQLRELGASIPALDLSPTQWKLHE